MKKWLMLAVSVVVVLTSGCGSARAQDTQNFSIRSFAAHYRLGRDQQQVATMRVEEEIVATFPNIDQNHGILRAIPQTYQNHSLDLDIESVTNAQGSKWSYDTYEQNDNLVLRIGDGDRYVHGEQTYRISYRLRGAASFYDTHDEIFWDVNGDQWPQAFGEVTATIHIPSELAGALRDDKRCFTDKSPGAVQSCEITMKDGPEEKLIMVRTTGLLLPNETLSFVLGFDNGTFAQYQRRPEDVLRILATVIGLGVVPPVAAGTFMLRRWYRYGRDPKGRGVIIPEYVPPKGLSVIDSQVLLKEGFDPKAISAQILDLAVRRYLKIYEVKHKKLLKDSTSYKVELVKTDKGLNNDERELLELLFRSGYTAGNTVDIDTLKNKLYTGAGKLGSAASKRLVANGYFAKEPSKAKAPYLIGGIVLATLGFIGIPFTLGLLAAGGILLLGSRAMPARTAKGVEARDHLLGLRDYMQLAEADRIRALQSPQGRLTEKVDGNDKTQLVKLYERLLPYAMLFGIEKDWAKQFADLYEQPPDWYSGTSGFHAASFANSLSGFSSASAASFTAPSSSSGSGFSGGGGSGGGGGGGGGGGW